MSYGRRGRMVMVGGKMQVARIGALGRGGRVGAVAILVFTFLALAFRAFEELPNGGRYFLL